MKLRFLGLLSLAMVVCLASALTAQEEGQQRQRGQRGGGGQRGGPGGRGGFGGMAGGFQMPGALELMSLLRDEKVREEVSIDDDTYEALRGAQPDMRSMFQASEEERTKMMKEANTKAQDMLDEVFEPAQQKRLMGLLVQQKGSGAATNDLIAKEIGLDEAGIKKVQEVTQEAQSGMREKMREMFQGGGGPPDREKMQAAMEDARKATEEAIAKALTDEQKQKLEALKGDKFEFSENRGFGRGQGGPGGGGRPGGRPGGNNNDN